MAEDVGFVNPGYEKRIKKTEQRLDLLVDRFGLLITAVKHLGNSVNFNTDEISRIGLELEEEKFRK